MQDTDEIVTKTISNAVKIGYSGKKLGNVNPRYSDDAEANFAKFIAQFPGKTVYDMPASGKDGIADADIQTPEQLWDTGVDVVFYEPGQNIIALAHVGTTGARLHLPRKVIKAISRPAANLHVYIGPHVSQKSYRFPDKEISEKDLDQSWDKYVSVEDDGWHIDLLGYVTDELKSAGIKPENIELSEVDTGSDKDYFSHRRHKITGEPTGRNCFAACLV
jgi:hypothetical protein